MCKGGVCGERAVRRPCARHFIREARPTLGAHSPLMGGRRHGENVASLLMFHMVIFNRSVSLLGKVTLFPQAWSIC